MATTLAAATLVGLYGVVVAGTADAVANAEATCTTWPTCTGRLLPSLHRGWRSLLAWSHRAAVLLVAVLLVATTVAALRERRSFRAVAALAVAAVLYPGEVVVGRVVFRTGSDATLHFALAAVIVFDVLAALVWLLDAERAAETPSPASALGGAPAVGGTQPDATSTPTDATPTPTDATPTPTDVTPAPSSFPRLRAYGSLMKLKLSWLLCLVALAAMVLARGASLDPVTAAGTLLGGVLAVGASGTFNHVLERGRDAEMARTADRPLATRSVPVRNAVAFGVALLVLSVATFVAFGNALAAALGVGAIAFYTVGYTVVLKPNTTWNTFVGGAVGAFPALIGWAAVTGDVGTPALALGAVVLCWTPAHFHNLALAYREDYANAGYPMLSVVRGPAVTRRRVVWFLGLTLLATVAFAALTHPGVGFALATTAATGVFAVTVLRLHRERTDAAAMRSFHASNVFLATVLCAVVLGGVV
ncbi:heme O synthase, protoheme IX farnesyltransferase COX10-CtaB [Halarchaeum acidiphilum MH1-52-1]|uniref:Protoheme IX farnesyltransferase n=1 Tax=Halarchaeum acidiphilum MH1-52-1 TaxID=1261545 RepID=U3A2P8_9EURY|nr:heme O synthase, protoheme IX farnesyltransferase COX10-CtaB [Halarchaeum acidiphilum MH1-52-1]